MKKRTLLASLLGLGLIVSVTFLVWKNYSGTSIQYISSFEQEMEEGEEHEAEGIAGAAEYFYRIKSDLNTGRVDPQLVMAAEKEMAAISATRKKAGWLKWTDLGPDDVGGRTRYLVIDKDDPQRLYAGGVTGGFWYSKNGGQTWIRGGGGNSESSNVNIVSITQAADGAIYYGTGELGFYSGSGEGEGGFIGKGIFKSTDRGLTFTHLTSTDPSSNTAWYNVHRLVSDPTNANKIFAGNDRGIYISNDGGQTWDKANLNIPLTFRCTDFYISTNGQTLFAVLGSSDRQQLWRSTDGGSSWDRLGTDPAKGTLDDNSSSYRVAVSRTNSNIVYLSSCEPGGPRSSPYKAMYLSEDNGESWVQVATGGSNFSPVGVQGSYDHCVVVDPINPYRVYVAGLNIWEGKKFNNSWQWKQLTNWTSEFYTNGQRVPYYVHADQHYMVFEKGETPALYITSDGGVSKSVDITYSNNPTFFNSDYRYNTVQFYRIAVSQHNRNEVIGGTQDNGTILANGAGISLQNSSDLRGGDGGSSEISKINPNVYFSQTPYGDVRRSFNKGLGDSWSEFFDSNIPASDDNIYPFITPMALWESLNDPSSKDTAIFVDEESDHLKGETVLVPSRNGIPIEHVLQQDLPKGTELKIKDIVQSKLYISTYNTIYMTREALVSSKTPQFFKIATLPISIENIEVSADGDVIFVAGSSSIYRITGLSKPDYKYVGGVFDDSDIQVALILSRSGMTATNVAIDPNDSNHVIATYGSYVSTQEHVYRSRNAMATSPTFQAIGNNLPHFPVYDALISMMDPDDYIVATEGGVWSSRDAGATWNLELDGIEVVPALSLHQVKYSTKPWAGPVVYVGTHGRGVFMTETIETGIIEPKDEVAAKIDMSIYPNPVITQANVKVSLGRSSDVQITLIDLQGKVVASENHRNQAAGDRVYSIDAAGLKPGTYFVKVTTATGERTSKMLKMN